MVRTVGSDLSYIFRVLEASMSVNEHMASAATKAFECLNHCITEGDVGRMHTIVQCEHFAEIPN